MRRSVALLAATIVVSALGSSSATAVTDPQVDAIVVLRSQADPAGITAPTRAQRLRLVEKALRDLAATTQRGALDLLTRRRKEGLVDTVVPLWIVNAISVHARASVIRELAARPEVAQVRPDFTVQAPSAVASSTATPSLVEPNVAVVNAPALWDLGYRGQGVVVASMDTGVDVTHPDLAAKWRGGSDSWYDPNGQHPAGPVDLSGHGTQTMGAIVGGEAGSSAIGVAPQAQWIAVKIFDDRGQATATRIHQGYQWLLDPDGNPATGDAPHVVNNSWTMSAGSCSLEFQNDLGSLRAAGVVPVFAAGNYGPGSGTSASPANNPAALAVGATDDADIVYPYSSRGPSACDQGTYPQVSAPGVNIRTTDLYGGYVDATGTSLAAPHVSGGLALLLQAVPGLSADQQVAALRSSAVDLGATGPDNTYGSGRLDLLAAYNWLRSTPDFTVSVSPSAVSVDPGGTATYTVTVTGTNGFAGDVALGLTGLPAGQGSAVFTPSVVAGGNGTAQLTISTSSTATPGTSTLTVSGTGAGMTRSGSASLTVVAPPDFSLGASPTSQTVPSGGSAAYVIGVTSMSGFTGDVQLSAYGLPAAVGSMTLSPAVVPSGGTSQLQVATLANAPAGTYPITVTGTSGSLSHSVTVTLTVYTRDFSLSRSPSAVTVTRGQTATYTVSVTPIGGFTGTVTLKLTGQPAGTSVSWIGNPVTGSGSATLKVRTTGSTVRTTYTLKITGTSGSLSHQVTVGLTVR